MTPLPVACVTTAGAAAALAEPGSERDPQTGLPFHSLPPPGALPPVSAAPSATASPLNVVCHGGPVQTAPRMYLIFWGSSWNDTSRHGGDPNGEHARVLSFARALGASRWINIDTQYYNPQRADVGNPKALVAGELDDASAPPASPRFADLANEAANAARSFGDYSVNANYVIFTPITNKPDGFESHYCAWHSYAPVGGRNVPFTNLPYVADGSRTCGGYLANRDADGVLDGVSIVLGHEQAETETDPLISGWWQGNLHEIADKCSWSGVIDNPAAGNFPTQPLWSNAASSCVQSY